MIEILTGLFKSDIGNRLASTLRLIGRLPKSIQEEILDAALAGDLFGISSIKLLEARHELEHSIQRFSDDSDTVPNLEKIVALYLKLRPADIIEASSDLFEDEMKYILTRISDYSGSFDYELYKKIADEERVAAISEIYLNR